MVALVVTFLAILPSAQAGERPSAEQTMEFVAFSTDGRLFALKVTDEAAGNLFQVRKTKKNQVVGSYVFNASNEEKVWRKVRREHRLEQEPVEAQENPKKGITLMTEVRGSKLRLMVMKGERILPYASVDLRTTRKGKAAEAFVKSVVWDQKGKYAVVIYHQAMADPLPWEGDSVHAFRYRSYKVDFGDGS
jgi:hypothetical protein